MVCRSEISQESKTARLDDDALKQCLRSLSERTRIDSSIYESMDVSRIDYTAYMLAEDPESIENGKSVVYYLEEVSFYLPGQLPKSPHKRFTLRPELLQRSEFSEKQFKGQPEIKIHKDVKVIEAASSRISDIAEYIVAGLECRCLETSDELYVSNEREFRELLNCEGLRL